MLIGHLFFSLITLRLMSQFSTVKKTELEWLQL